MFVSCNIFTSKLVTMTLHSQLRKFKKVLKTHTKKGKAMRYAYTRVYAVETNVTLSLMAQQAVRRMEKRYNVSDEQNDLHTAHVDKNRRG